MVRMSACERTNLEKPKPTAEHVGLGFYVQVSMVIFFSVWGRLELKVWIYILKTYLVNPFNKGKENKNPLEM